MRGQTKRDSLLEAFLNILIGYGIAIMAQWVIFPLFGMHPSLRDNLQIGALFTVVSLVRSYCLRRLFNLWHVCKEQRRQEQIINRFSNEATTMTKPPRRVQRSRLKGWRLPENTVCVDRSSRWGNPFPVGGERQHPLGHLGMVQVRNNHHAVVLFDNWLDTTEEGKALLEAAKVELRGKNLACFCSLGVPCHADILLVRVNK